MTKRAGAASAKEMVPFLFFKNENTFVSNYSTRNVFESSTFSRGNIFPHFVFQKINAGAFSWVNMLDTFKTFCEDELGTIFNQTNLLGMTI